MGRFLARHPLLVLPSARAGMEARRRWKARRASPLARAIEVGAEHREGRLLARPRVPGESAPTGLRPLAVDGDTTALLYVPVGYRPSRPARFALMLHGATSVGLAALYLLLPFSDAANLIVLAPDAARWTWDRVLGGYGPDAAYLDRALAATFARYAVDPRAVAIGGFSDGASYALSLGLMNGDLFTHVVAFSPGFLSPGPRHGQPRIFDSHGTADEILPVACSERIVSVLRGSGYDVTFVPFAGPHVVPFPVAHQAVQWLVSDLPPCFRG